MEVAIVFFAILIVVLFFALVVKSPMRESKTGSGNSSRIWYGDDARDISEMGINEIKSSGRFTAGERAAEYRRRGKSPSGVIDGVYSDAYRGNDEYNDTYRDWDADA